MELQNGHASSYMNNTPEHIKDHHKETNVFGLNEQSCQDDNLWVESKNVYNIFIFIFLLFLV